MLQILGLNNCVGNSDSNDTSAKDSDEEMLQLLRHNSGSNASSAMDSDEEMLKVLNLNGGIKKQPVTNPSSDLKEADGEEEDSDTEMMRILSVGKASGVLEEDDEYDSDVEMLAILGRNNEAKSKSERPAPASRAVAKIRKRPMLSATTSTPELPSDNVDSDEEMLAILARNPLNPLVETVSKDADKTSAVGDLDSDEDMLAILSKVSSTPAPIAIRRQNENFELANSSAQTESSKVKRALGKPQKVTVGVRPSEQTLASPGSSAQTKRGHGRRRKTAVKSAAVAQASNNCPVPSKQTLTSPVSSAQAKRGRGRPRKSAVESSTVPQAPVVFEQTFTSTGSSLKAKRGHERPPKKTIVARQSQVSSEQTLTSAQSKKDGGKPSKETVETPVPKARKSPPKLIPVTACRMKIAKEKEDEIVFDSGGSKKDEATNYSPESKKIREAESDLNSDEEMLQLLNGQCHKYREPTKDDMEKGTKVQHSDYDAGLMTRLVCGELRGLKAIAREAGIEGASQGDEPVKAGLIKIGQVKLEAEEVMPVEFESIWDESTVSYSPTGDITEDVSGQTTLLITSDKEKWNLAKTSQKRPPESGSAYNIASDILSDLIASF
jgi:hypothetical protein